MASAGELAAIDGIGETTAEKIRWALEEPPADYGV
jgi:DNA uptake protein ComE-like DNA-binding protein